jgi:hypothetical protein
MQALIVWHLSSRAVIEARKSSDGMHTLDEQKTSCTGEGRRKETITKERTQEENEGIQGRK